MINEGGAYLNNTRVLDPEARPGVDDVLGRRWLVLRRGKRQLAGVRVVDDAAGG
jgi:tyrosyl-tRNA synthetase